MTGRRPYYVAANARPLRPQTYMPAGTHPRRRRKPAVPLVLVVLVAIAAACTLVALLALAAAAQPSGPVVPGRSVSTTPNPPAGGPTHG